MTILPLQMCLLQPLDNARNQPTRCWCCDCCAAGACRASGRSRRMGRSPCACRRLPRSLIPAPSSPPLHASVASRCLCSATAGRGRVQAQPPRRTHGSSTRRHMRTHVQPRPARHAHGSSADCRRGELNHDCRSARGSSTGLHGASLTPTFAAHRAARPPWAEDTVESEVVTARQRRRA
jgi:hypothetical protein